jgi:hypothetical protein
VVPDAEEVGVPGLTKAEDEVFNVYEYRRVRPVGLIDTCEDVWIEYSRAQLFFAGYKNHGRRLLDLEGLLRFIVDDMLELERSRSSARQSKWRKRVRFAVMSEGKFWRSISNLHARAWSCLSSYEMLRDMWVESRTSILAQSDDNDCLLLFDTDFVSDADHILNVDFGLLTDALGHTGRRLDNRDMVNVTLRSALVGGVVAAIVATLVALVLK